MEGKGYFSVSDFCKKTNLREGIINSIVRGATKPLKKDGSLIPMVSNLLEYLDLSVEDAFTERQLQGFNKNSFQVEMSESQLISISSLSSLPTKNAELLAMEGEVQDTLKTLMNKILTPREERLVRGYYFENESIIDIAEKLSLSRTRADQILKQSLFKLSKHYGVLDKSGIKEVFPRVDNVPVLEMRQDYGSFRRILKKRKEEKSATL